MLPFLKSKNQSLAGLIIAHRKPDGGMDKEPESYDELCAAAEDLIHAIHAKDAKAVAAAWRAGQEILGIQFPEESDENASS